MIELQPMCEQDLEYLYWLCESTMRTHTEEVWDSWNELEIRHNFMILLADKKFQQILEKDIRVGAISVEHHETHIQLEQIFIEPDHQSRGLGGMMVKKLIADAKEAALPIRLRVLKPNPAKIFYERHGFEVYQTTHERYFMEYKI